MHHTSICLHISSKISSTWFCWKNFVFVLFIKLLIDLRSNNSTCEVISNGPTCGDCPIVWWQRVDLDFWRLFCLRWFKNLCRIVFHIAVRSFQRRWRDAGRRDGLDRRGGVFRHRPLHRLREGPVIDRLPDPQEGNLLISGQLQGIFLTWLSCDALQLLESRGFVS